jgi:hypothetical protein
MSSKIKLSVNTLNKATMECDVHVFLNYGRDLIPNCFVITEREDNPGMSVTNASEYIAMALVERYKIDDPHNCVFIEHYPYEVPTWDRVTFQWSQHYRTKKWQAMIPAWERVPEEALKLIIDRMDSDDLNQMADDLVEMLLPEDND